LHQKHVGSDGGVRADDCFAAKDGRVRINRNIVFLVWMPFAAFDNVTRIVFDKAARAQRHAVIPVSDYSGDDREMESCGMTTQATAPPKAHYPQSMEFYF
jgi:hypothetical protein